MACGKALPGSSLTSYLTAQIAGDSARKQGPSSPRAGALVSAALKKADPRQSHCKVGIRPELFRQDLGTGLGSRALGPWVSQPRPHGCLGVGLLKSPLRLRASRQRFVLKALREFAAQAFACDLRPYK